MILVPLLNPKFANGLAARWCANFGFAAPAPVGAIFTSETWSIAKLGEKQMGAITAQSNLD